jgi:hypothetical protein
MWSASPIRSFMNCLILLVGHGILQHSKISRSVERHREGENLLKSRQLGLPLSTQLLSSSMIHGSLNGAKRRTLHTSGSKISTIQLAFCATNPSFSATSLSWLHKHNNLFLIFMLSSSSLRLLFPTRAILPPSRYLFVRIGWALSPEHPPYARKFSPLASLFSSSELDTQSPHGQSSRSLFDLHFLTASCECSILRRKGLFQMPPCCIQALEVLNNISMILDVNIHLIWCHHLWIYLR